MTNTANTIAFNVGTPTIAGPNSGFINGVKFTGPTKTGKFWIAATSANAKAGSTREPNSKEKADLLAAFKTAFVAVTEGVATPEGDAFVNTVVAANTPAAKPEAAAKSDDKGGEASADNKSDAGDAKGDDAGAATQGEAAAGGEASAPAASTKGGDFSGSDTTEAAAE